MSTLTDIQSLRYRINRLESASGVTSSEVSGAISNSSLSASQIVAGQITYARNSVALIDTYTITISNNTGTIDPMSGSAQFINITADTQLSATFVNVPTNKSTTTAIWVTSSAVSKSFAGIDYWMGTNPGTVATTGSYMLVLTNFVSGSSNKIIGSWQTLV